MLYKVTFFSFYEICNNLTIVHFLDLIPFYRENMYEHSFQVLWSFVIGLRSVT
jgi:hypothetical protein